MKRRKLPQPSYTTRLQKGGALLDDMRLLVRSWREEFAAAPLEAAHGILGKKTVARSRDIVVRAFRPRYLHGEPPNAWRLVRPLEDRNVDLEVVCPLYYWVTTRAEQLLYDFVVGELAGLASAGHRTVRIDETVNWIRGRLHEHGLSWSPTVTLKVGRGVLAALRDFGILEGRAVKRLAPVHLPSAAFSYLAFCLSRLGAGAESLVTHPDWGLFLLSSDLVERLFLEAHQRGHLSFQSAGRLYRVEFPAATHEEYADVLLGA